LIDVIGIPDERPDVGWDVGDTTDATVNHTLLRKYGTSIGNTDWAASAGTNNDDSEWVVYAVDFIDNLGSPTTTASNEAEILTFELDEEKEDAVINSGAATVDIIVVQGTPVTALVPTITISDYASISPVSGVAQDFTSPVVYTVTAEDESTKDWTVTVTVSATARTAAEITEIEVVGADSTKINSVDTTIVIYAPYGFVVTSVEPEFVISAGATISDTTSAHDFTTPVTYVVTAQDGSTIKNWEVSVEVQQATELTIYAIQYTEDASGDSDHIGVLATTSGIVTATYSSGYFIQDNDEGWHGLFIYDNTNTPAVGDSVEVTGTVAEVQDHTEIGDIVGYSVLNTGLSLFDPIELTTVEVAEEQYEGVLLSVTEAECMSAPDTYKVWTVDDGSGVLSIDNVIYEHTPTVGTKYDITGIMHGWYGIVLLPRSASDLNAYPVINGITLDPTTPNSDQAVTVSATIIDEETAASGLTVKLFYGSAAGSEDTEVTFAQVGTTDEFEGTIPASSSTVYYKITANDGTLDSEQTGSYDITATGISNPDGFVSMNIYPNPSNGNFTLEMNASKAGTFNVEIINIQGQVVFTKEINQDGFYKETIDISNNASGIYYLRINDGKNLKVSKIMIQ
ncbi:MAG: T9SS type A sorting domain-containing protein, partial [Bacteroidales bacterium]|nr:T9SS type A sorting domain-containing protein [Bacteroidales bacterium]